jgi:hypothetical protein
VSLSPSETKNPHVQIIDTYIVAGWRCTEYLIGILERGCFALSANEHNLCCRAAATTALRTREHPNTATSKGRVGAEGTPYQREISILFSTAIQRQLLPVDDSSHHDSTCAWPHAVFGSHFSSHDF